MWVRKRLEIGWSDLICGVASCLRPARRAPMAARIEACWSTANDAFCCLSVRTGWDLLLAALDLPRGSEVLVSALTIKDMVRIIEDHGLTPVPVDLDPDRLAVSIESVERAITPATRVILVAHLFGCRAKLAALTTLAHRHGLMVVEDCAQAFTGLETANDSDADVSMFSFGNIKTATALGGGVLRVRNAQTLTRMRELQAKYPVQSRLSYLQRLLKYSVLKGLSAYTAYSLFARLCRVFGTDHDRVASRTVRGFAGPDFFGRIRRQPSLPLLALLYRRLTRFDHAALKRRTQQGQLLRLRLGDEVQCPGAEATAHSYWVFPILADDVEGMIATLWQSGFDATQAQSLSPVDPPAGRRDLAAVQATAMLAKTIYLPCYPELPTAALEQMALIVRAHTQPRPTLPVRSSSDRSPVAAGHLAT